MGGGILKPVHLGVLLMALNAAMSASDAILARAIATELHPFQIAFSRNLFSLLALMAILPRREWRLDAGGLWPVHGTRALVKLIAMVCYFGAITLIPVASVTAIAFAMPVFAMIGSALFLHEPMRAPRVLAILAGVAGMLLILRPGTMGMGWGEGLAILSALAFAVVAVLMKFSAVREAPMRIVWFNLLATVPLAAALAAPVWVWPSAGILALCALQGVGGLLAQLAFARAMKLADASLLISVDFIRLPLAALLAFLLFQEAVQANVLLGGGVILTGVIYAAWREGKRRDIPPPPP